MNDHVESSNRFKEKFGLTWEPVAIYYSEELPEGAVTFKSDAWACVVSLFLNAAKGTPAAADEKSHGCMGAGRYLGFKWHIRENMEHFLSCGIPGEMEGERYIKTPETAKRFFESQHFRPAPARWCVFMPWPKVPPDVAPELVAFAERPDVISALAIQADYTREARESTVLRMAAGCASVVMEPLFEAQSDDPRAVLGMTDISARVRFPAERLSYTVPWKLLKRMEADLGQSFLIQEPWLTVRGRGLNTPE